MREMSSSSSVVESSFPGIPTTVAELFGDIEAPMTARFTWHRASDRFRTATPPTSNHDDNHLPKCFTWVSAFHFTS